MKLHSIQQHPKLEGQHEPVQNWYDISEVIKFFDTNKFTTA